MNNVSYQNTYVRDATEPEKKKDSGMSLLMPIFGVATLLAIGGAIWYSVKKEEEFGLIGKVRV